MKRIFSIFLAVLLLTGMLSIVASAEDIDTTTESTVTVTAGIRVGTVDAQGKYAHLDLLVNEGETKYLLTDENGVARTDGASAENYNIKLDMRDGQATLYLKDAKLVNNRWHGLSIGYSATGTNPAVTDFPCSIVVESDSYIEGGKYSEGNMSGSYQGLVFNNNHAGVIIGPGKLTVKSLRVCAITAPAGLSLQSVKLEAENNYDSVPTESYACIWVRNGNLTVDNSELTAINNNGSALLLSASNSSVAGAAAGDIVIQNGTKADLATKAGALPCVGTNGTFKIENAEVTITAQSQCYSAAPEMTDVVALGGTQKAGAALYNDEKSMSYTYFVCGPDVQVPTIETLPPVTVPPTTQQVPATTQQVPATTQQQTPATTQQVPPTTQAAPNATEPVDNGQTGSGIGLTVVVIVLAALAVLGAGTVTAVIIINKKKGNL